MIPKHVVQAVNEAIALLGIQFESEAARVLLYAIGLQESAFAHRRQVVSIEGVLKPVGPATGYWQFEEGGGVRGVVKHPVTRPLVMKLCKARGVAFNPRSIWEALQTDDVLAAGIARLLLWSDPRAFPRLSDVRGMWLYYERNWRPGKPHPEKWPALYATALQFVLEGAK